MCAKLVRSGSTFSFCSQLTRGRFCTRHLTPDRVTTTKAHAAVLDGGVLITYYYYYYYYIHLALVMDLFSHFSPSRPFHLTRLSTVHIVYLSNFIPWVPLWLSAGCSSSKRRLEKKEEEEEDR